LELFEDTVLVEEKVDGSQFSFGAWDGELVIRSKGAQIDPESPPKMFEEAVDTVKSIQHLLPLDMIYRGEVLCKPKHNTLGYDRVPVGNIIIFDIGSSGENYLDYVAKVEEATRVGLETVPRIWEGVVTSDILAKLIQDMTTVKSILGDVPIEGMVFKNYFKFGPDKKILMGKVVSMDFQERHQSDWRTRNPGGKDVVEMIGMDLNTEARFRKTIQHLRDDGVLVGETKDIGPLIRALNEDILNDESDQIKERLFAHFKKDVMRRATYGFPEFYKEYLLTELVDGT
ncbi:MAG: hypothetical protein IH823_07100, partial [Candidatus Dadabacteria bacterium]|nr:hypothetical protein [Candidatus Dadabacteria bacterium]